MNLGVHWYLNILTTSAYKCWIKLILFRLRLLRLMKAFALLISTCFAMPTVRNNKKSCRSHLLTPTLSGFEILNDSTLIFKNWRSSRLFINIFYTLIEHEYFRLGTESYSSLGRVEKREEKSVSTFGRFRLSKSLESLPVSVKN